MSDVQTHGASGWWKWFTGRKAAEMPVQASARELGRSRRATSVPLREREIDYALAGVVLALLLWGLVMVYSASIGLPESRTFANYSRTHFLTRHVMALGIGFVVSLLAFQVSMKAWEKMAPWLFLASLVLLAAVLLPVIGKEVNGARRWIPLGIMNFQPSELVKLTVAIYAASYMTRKMEVREKFLRAVAPMVGAVAVVGILLLAEPDMGAFLVMAAIAMGVLFIGGVNMRAIFLVGAVAVLAFVLMVTLTEWRNERLEAFLDPWSEQHSKGKAYQMIQSLIAISRGGLTGQGLGASVEKLLWLPEAHTDFIVAVIGEELGLAGLLVLFFLYLWMVRRMMHIGRQAISLDRVFAGLTAQGIGLWFGVQGFINMGVGLGLLPTKGLTLPFISYGGSAIMMGMVGVAIVLRVDYENRESMQKGRRK